MKKCVNYLNCFKWGESSCIGLKMVNKYFVFHYPPLAIWRCIRLVCWWCIKLVWWWLLHQFGDELNYSGDDCYTNFVMYYTSLDWRWCWRSRCSCKFSWQTLCLLWTSILHSLLFATSCLFMPLLRAILHLHSCMFMHLLCGGLLSQTCIWTFFFFRPNPQASDYIL